MDILDSLEWPGLDGRVGGCAGRSPARRWVGVGEEVEVEVGEEVEVEVGCPAAARPVAGTSAVAGWRRWRPLARAARPAVGTGKPIAPARRKAARPRAEQPGEPPGLGPRHAVAAWQPAGQPAVRRPGIASQSPGRQSANREDRQSYGSSSSRPPEYGPRACRKTGRTGPMITMVTVMEGIVTAAPMRPGLSLAWSLVRR